MSFFWETACEAIELFRIQPFSQRGQHPNGACLLRPDELLCIGLEMRERDVKAGGRIAQDIEGKDAERSQTVHTGGAIENERTTDGRFHLIGQISVCPGKLLR